MRTAREIQGHLEALYQTIPDAASGVPRYLQVHQWVYFAKEYLAASSRLNGERLHMIRPWMQVSGHAIECAIKAYLCAVRSKVPKEHDIVKLVDVAVAAGLSISERNLAMIVHVNHLYSCDLRSATKYKARYPSKHMERSGGSLPDMGSIKQIVDETCQQAMDLNEASNSPLAATKRV